MKVCVWQPHQENRHERDALQTGQVLPPVTVTAIHLPRLSPLVLGQGEVVVPGPA